MVKGQMAQDTLAFGSKRKKHLPPVVPAAMSADKAARGEAIHELDRAVMLYLKPVGQFADTRAHALGHTLERQQQLMLPRFQAGCLGGVFTEMQKAPYLVPKFRQ